MPLLLLRPGGRQWRALCADPGPRQDDAVCRPVAPGSGVGWAVVRVRGCGGSPPVGHFMIARIDTSACTSGLKLHAGVSILAIMTALPAASVGAGTSDRPRSARRPATPLTWLLKAADGNHV